MCLDLAVKGEKDVNTKVMKAVAESQPRWQRPTGVVYDGAATLYATASLLADGEERLVLPLRLPGSTQSFNVRIALVGKLWRPPEGKEWHAIEDQPLLQALDTGLLSFARWQKSEDLPSWLHTGAKVFRSVGSLFRE